MISYRLQSATAPGAPRLALIHSLGLDGSVWDGVADELAGDADILIYDCRGHGRSCRQAKSFTTGLFARDLAELLDYLEWPNATIVGCSMGGCIAQAFAARYPERTNALGLVDTTAWYGADAPRVWRERAETARVQGLSALTAFQGLRWFGDDFRTRNPAVLDAMTEVFLANDVDCYGATCCMMGDADLRPLQHLITAPVAIVVGEEDYATPVAMAQQMHGAIPGSTMRVLDGVRHLAPVEAPEQIGAVIRGLLDRLLASQVASSYGGG